MAVAHKPLHILLFGGSFDPPHLGHRWVIENALELIPQIDELWLLPTANHAFDKKLTPVKHRLNMCRLLFGNLTSKIRHQIKLCSLEIDYNLTGSTYQALKLLQKEEAYLKQEKLLPPSSAVHNTKYSFLIGSDQLKNFHQWENYRRLLQKMTFYVYPRANYPLKPLYQHMIPLTAPTQIITNLSSTLIKSRLSQNLPAHSLLPKTIHSYIHHHSLYSPSS